MPRSFERRLLVAAIAVWALVTILSFASGPPLGHDEAAFSILARGGGSTWLYRSSGVIAIARIGVWLGGAEWQLRLTSAVIGLGVVLATYAVGRRAFGAGVGAWAAAVIAGAHPMVLRSTELIGDVPATACVLAGIAVLLGELSREDGPTFRLLAAAPAFAAGFYLRYGSAPVIAIAGLAAAVLYARAIRVRPAPVIASAAAFAALLLPHAIQSLRVTGKLLGILEVSSAMPRRAYIGEGLVTYVTSDPLRYYGALVGPLAIAGLVALCRPPARWRPTALLGAIAVGQILAIGLESHAQPRYVFIATTLLVVLGVELAQRTLRPRRHLALALVCAAWLGAAIAIVPYNRYIANLRGPLMAAATAIRADDAGRPCTIVSRVVTQLMWYTGCDSLLLRDPDHLDDVTPGHRVYFVSVPHGVAQVAPVARTLHSVATPLATGDPLSQVWTLAPAPR
ncbi:MAG TPA: glycosyltransferase family 39 protein [Kofleriaceae bacterium]|nr:glycosyltransferase family 39 protein [Kofleriaceae bacterium]